MSEEKEESTAFLRQRRDLFVISAILLLIPIAQIHIADKISMQQLGITLDIGKPKMIIYALWALWAYWYLRYFQAYQAIGVKFLRDRFHSEMSSYLYPEFSKLAEEVRSLVISEHEVLNKAGTLCSYNFKAQEFLIFKAEYTCEYSAYIPDLGKPVGVDKKLVYKGFKYHLTQVKTLTKCCFKCIEFTEYLLPFIFGISPLTYFIFTLI